MELNEFIKKYNGIKVNEKELCDKLGIKQKYDKWVPKVGERYWYITSSGVISADAWHNDIWDKFRSSKRNMYQTEEQCRFALDMYNFCKEHSFEPDFNNYKQSKYFITLDHGVKRTFIDSWFGDVFQPFYYPTEDAVQEILDEYSVDELIEYYGRV